jgi:hypothetical protein
MDQNELAVLRLRLRVDLLERLVLMNAFAMPLSSDRLSPQESAERLTNWLDTSGTAGDVAFGEHFRGDPAQAALYAEEWKTIADDMKATVAQLG